MADTQQQSVRDDVNVCQLCGQLENLSVCGACKSTWYCSKQHQKQDWKKHKHVCKKVDSANHETGNIYSATTLHNGNDGNQECTEKNSRDSPENNNNVKAENLKRNESSSDKLKEKGVIESDCDNNQGQSQNKQKQNQCTPKTKDKHPNSKAQRKKKKDLTKEGMQNNVQQRYYLDESNQILSLPPSVTELSDRKSAEHNKSLDMGKDTRDFPSFESKEQYLLILQARFNEVAKYVVKCLTQYGVCVVDKFLGEATAEEIFKEVLQLQSSGIMNQGQLVNGPTSSCRNKEIRGDITTWLDGSEARCENIHYLISCMDTVMLQGAKSLEQCVINERTKAMVACYPGKGRGYIRHIDNPNGDGRVVTSLYYLNKNWEAKTDGGLLRIYPEGSDQVANIEPVADRLVFFWSDKRNPHEVTNSLRERYAITVWYYDAEERAQALQKLKMHSSSSDSSLSEKVKT